MNEELKPCPFCRSAEIGLNRPTDYRTGPHVSDWFVQCYGCNATTCEYQTEAEAITAWNTRAPAENAEPVDFVTLVETWHHEWVYSNIGQRERVWGDSIEWLSAVKTARRLQQHFAPAPIDIEAIKQEARREALEEAAKVADRNAKWHEESFRKELILKHEDRQTHFAARSREAEEIAAAIRALSEGTEHDQ